MVCLPVSQLVSVTVMKNWLPLVLGPELAMASLPGLLEAVFGAPGLVGELVAGAAHAGAFGVAALDHELGDDAMEDGAVVELRALLAAAVPVLGAFGEADKVGDGLGCVFFEELDRRPFLRWF